VGSPDAWCLAFGYGLQLFFDFAGYTHIAVGAARALGITVPENFDRPFASTSPSIFWTRWHRSLSFWIRDYVFFPLAPLRREMWWRNLALALSMVVFGLCHGATVLFLIWGSYHGVFARGPPACAATATQIQLGTAANLWTPFSWAATAAAGQPGMGFVPRKFPLPQAGEMLSAIFSPASYSAHFLSSVSTFSSQRSLRILVGAAGWRCDRSAGRNAGSPASRSGGHIPGSLALVLIPSLYLLALIFVLMIRHGQQPSAGQLMYRRF
jgi:alginate O-acetyltransferase complex protein AlgI